MLSRPILSLLAKRSRRSTSALHPGPVVVPLNVTRRSDSYSIFIAVAKGPARQWAGYLSADTSSTNSTSSGEPLSMVELPQMVQGSQYFGSRRRTIGNARTIRL